MPPHLLNYIVQKAQGCLLVTLVCHVKIDSVTLLFDGAIKVFSLAFAFDVGLRDAGPIHPPTKACPFLAFPKSFLDTRSVTHDPSLSGTVIHDIATLLARPFDS